MPTKGGGGGGGGASAKDTRAGGAFFELLAKDNLTHVLDRIKKKALSFSAAMSKVGTTALAAGAGLAAPLAALFKGGADRAAEVGKLSQQFGVPVELMSKLEYAAKQAGVSVDEVMSDTSGRFSELVARAPSISGADAAQALQMQRDFANATDALQAALMPLLTTVTPIVKMFSEFVQQNAHVLRVVVPVAAGLIGVGLAIKVVSLATAGAVAALGLLGAVAAIVFKPFVLVAAVVGGLGYVLATQTERGREFTAMVRTGLVDALNTLKDTFGGVSDALAKGDLALAGKVAFAGLKVLVADFISVATTWWTAFKMVFVDTWHTMILGARLAWNDFTAAMHIGFEVMVANVISAMHYMGRVVLDVAIKAAEAMDSLDPTDSLKGAIARAKGLREGLGGVGWKEAADRIEGDRARKEKELVDRFEKARKERDAARMEDVMGADERLKKAKAELDALRAEAALPGAKPELKGTPLAAQLKAAEAVKGTFSGAALGQAFGVSSNAQKQTELLKNIRDNGKDMVKEMKDFGKGK